MLSFTVYSTMSYPYGGGGGGYPGQGQGGYPAAPGYQQPGFAQPGYGAPPQQPVVSYYLLYTFSGSVFNIWTSSCKYQ